MTTLESTISILEGLPETDLLKIQALAKKLFQRHEDKTADEAVGRFLKPMSREDFMRDIKIAEEEFARGEYQEIGEAFDEIYRELKYKVIITRSARMQFAQILRYLRQDLGNEQAASPRYAAVSVNMSVNPAQGQPDGVFPRGL